MLISLWRLHRGWFIVAVVFLSAGLLIGTSNYAFYWFIDGLEETFNWPRTAIGASLSFMAVGSISSPFLGRLMDRYGARPIMAGSLIVFGISFALRPLISELWHLYFLSFLQFVCFSGGAMLPAGRLVGIWFPRTRGRVMGIAMVGNNFGGLIMPSLTGYIFVSGISWGFDAPWKTAFIVISAISFLLAIAVVLVVNEETAPATNSKNSLDDTSYKKEHRLRGWTLREALHTRSFYGITLVAMLASFTYSLILPHVAGHLDANEISASLLIFAVPLLAGFGMGGKVIFGYLAERITARIAMIGSLSGQIVFIVLMVLYPETLVIWIAVPLYGFFMGGYGVLVTVIIQDSFGIKYFGSISGFSQMATVVPMVAGPLMAGASFDRWGGYGPAFVLVAGCFAISVVILLNIPSPNLNSSGIVDGIPGKTE